MMRARTSCLPPDYEAQPMLMSSVARLALKGASLHCLRCPPAATGHRRSCWRDCFCPFVPANWSCALNTNASAPVIWHFYRTSALGILSYNACNNRRKISTKRSPVTRLVTGDTCHALVTTHLTARIKFLTVIYLFTVQPLRHFDKGPLKPSRRRQTAPPPASLAADTAAHCLQDGGADAKSTYYWRSSIPESSSHTARRHDIHVQSLYHCSAYRVCPPTSPDARSAMPHQRSGTVSPLKSLFATQKQLLGNT